jgi:hypothetical protein
MHEQDADVVLMTCWRSGRFLQAGRGVRVDIAIARLGVKDLAMLGAGDVGDMRLVDEGPYLDGQKDGRDGERRSPADLPFLAVQPTSQAAIPSSCPYAI